MKRGTRCTGAVERKHKEVEIEGKKYSAKSQITEIASLTSFLAKRGDGFSHITVKSL